MPKKKRSDLVNLKVVLVFMFVLALSIVLYLSTIQAENDAALQSTSSAVVANESTSQEGPEPSTNFLVIPEWGIKLEQSDPAVEYKLSKVEKDGSQVAYISSLESVGVVGSECKLVAIVRTSTEPSNSVVNPDSVERIGQHFYYAIGSKASCVSKDKQEVEAAVKVKLLNTANTFQAS